MKKRFLLLLLVACAPIVEESVPVIESPIEPIPVVPELPVLESFDNYVIKNLSSFVTADVTRDSFGIFPVVRYDARYQTDITVLVHLFKFSSREMLEVVLNSEFYHIVNFGLFYYRGNDIALFLTPEDHRVALWPSGTLLVYVESFFPFASPEIVEAYLKRYPSDLETQRCVDSDGDNHLTKGKTNRVQIGSSVIEWSDVCLKDFAMYRNGQYVPLKKFSVVDGLLEGHCGVDVNRPGFISEYVCPRGCSDGVCSLA